MDCITKIKDGAEILVEYCSGAADAARAREIENHIAGCKACGEMVAAQRELWRTLDAWTAPEVSEHFDARLYARIAREEAAPLWRQWARRILEPALPVAMWKPAVSLAALCAVLAMGLMLRSPQAAHVPEMSKQVRAEHAIDMEQVADALDDLEMLSPGSAM